VRVSLSIIVLLLIVVLSYLTITIWSSQDFEAKGYKSSTGNSINYRIHAPEKMDTNKKYSLIVFFHGAG